MKKKKELFNPTQQFQNFVDDTYKDWENDPIYQREQAALDRAEQMGDEDDAQCASDVIDRQERSYP